MLVITAAITFIAMWYIYHLMNKVKTQVIYDRRKARYESFHRSPIPPFYSPR